MKNKNTNNIKDDINLEIEFAKIGFDYKIMLNNARYVNNWTILLSAEDNYSNVPNCKDKIVFSFTVISYGNSNQRSIHHVRATLLKSVPNSNQSKVLIAKDYWDYNGPLPTKEQIVKEMTTMLKEKRVDTSKSPVA